MTSRGRFISFEGIDGAGKSTHLPFVAEWVRERGHEAVVTREPGGTPVGERLRALLLSDAMQPDTEALLMFASRREQVLDVIEPALSRGAWVICDRFTDSTYAYQCGGRGLPEERIATLEQWVHADCQPDLTLLFDAPAEVAQGRVVGAARELDKFERERADFFSRVREAYLSRARRYPGRIKVIDSTRGIADIQLAIRDVLAGLPA